MRNKQVIALVMCALAVAINMVLGALVQNLKIPLIFLDTIGTIFVAVLFGPWQGAAVGTVTNILTPLLTGNPKDIPFFIVNALVGIIVGYSARKFKFNMVTAVATGIVLSIVCPIVGTFIATGVYGGITGSTTDIFFLWLKNSGMSVFTSAFLPRITENFIDKIGSCILVFLAMKYIPKQYKSSVNENA